MTHPGFDLSGKTALVTGGNSGIASPCREVELIEISRESDDE